jgi:hypothetical protein
MVFLFYKVRSEFLVETVGAIDDNTCADTLDYVVLHSVVDEDEAPDGETQ